jgi:hypothetical protein
MEPFAVAQTGNQPLPQLAISQPAMQPAAVSRHGQQPILPPRPAGTTSRNGIGFQSLSSGLGPLQPRQWGLAAVAIHRMRATAKSGIAAHSGEWGGRHWMQPPMTDRV